MFLAPAAFCPTSEKQLDQKQEKQKKAPLSSTAVHTSRLSRLCNLSRHLMAGFSMKTVAPLPPAWCIWTRKGTWEKPGNRMGVLKIHESKIVVTPAFIHIKQRSALTNCVAPPTVVVGTSARWRN